MNIKSLMNRLFAEFQEANPNIPSDKFNQMVEQVTNAVDSEPPPRIAFIGESGVGKSSTLNALFNAGQEVSHTQAQTQTESAIEVKANTVDGEKGVLVVYDMPGLGESILKRDQHTDTYRRVLKDVDVALWVLDAQNRAIESVQNHLREELSDINRGLVNRLVFAVNKIDLVHPERSWIEIANLPSEQQEENIQRRLEDVRSRVREAVPEWSGQIVGYSATRRYNLPHLFNAMLDAVPKKRQWVVTSRKALADYLEFIDPYLLPAELRAQALGDNIGGKNKLVTKLLEDMTPEEFTAVTRDKRAFLAYLDKEGLN